MTTPRMHATRRLGRSVGTRDQLFQRPRHLGSSSRHRARRRRARREFASGSTATSTPATPGWRGSSRLPFERRRLPAAPLTPSPRRMVTARASGERGPLHHGDAEGGGPDPHEPRQVRGKHDPQRVHGAGLAGLGQGRGELKRAIGGADRPACVRIGQRQGRRDNQDIAGQDRIQPATATGARPQRR